MSEPSNDRTDVHQPSDALDAGLAAAFGPDSGPPAGSSVLRALGAEMPGVQLRDADSDRPIVLPHSDQMPGKQDAGSRYQWHGEIARGGMGAILKGRDVDLGRDIAVKVLLESHAGRTELLQRFVEEAQIAGQLQHPGIVPVYELGQFADRRPYFTMKLVKGDTLAKLLAEHGEPGQEQTRWVGVFLQVCQTVAFAHARGVIHRDLKPSNVMVGSFGEVQVMDWGLAKVLPQGGVADEEKAQQVSVIQTARSGTSVPGVGSHTLAGSVLGTPAYMAPEQARGDVTLIDERADVFGLGSILCEVLTGQPPFTGKTIEATRKAQSGDLTDALTRLDGCGADQELIALAKACLAALPWHRPRHAGAVAEAVETYQHAVADRLRQSELDRTAAEARAEQEGRTRVMAEARALEERRRRRATLALAASVLALVVFGGGAGVWWWQESTARTRAVQAALDESAHHRESGRWAEAHAALARAEGRLGSGGSAALRRQVDQAREDAALVATLEDIRLRQSEIREGRFDTHSALPRYANAFRDYGLDVEALDEQTVIDRIRNSAIREALLEALDNWLHSTRRGDLRSRLRAVADGADDSEWRKSMRQLLEAGDARRWRALARDEQTPLQSPALVVRLGMALRAVGEEEEAVRLLREAQHRFPADFWIHYQLANTLYSPWSPRSPQSPQSRLPEAIGSYRAALALRPNSAGVHNNLSIVLKDHGDLKGAVASARKAIEIDPNSSLAHDNLGNALLDQGQFSQAEEAHRRAVELENNHPGNHYNLANTLLHQKKYAAAIPIYKKALALDPQFVSAHTNLGIALREVGKLDESLASFQKALDINERHFSAHVGMALTCQAKGMVDAAIASYRQAIRIDTGNVRVHIDLGTLLCDVKRDFDAAMPCFHKAIDLDPRNTVAHVCMGVAWEGKGKLDQATEWYRKALAFDPKYAPAHGNQGNVLLKMGKIDEAITSFRQAIAFDPRLGTAHGSLGSALLRKGRFAEARDACAEALKLIPPKHRARTSVSHNLDSSVRLLKLEERLPRLLGGEEKAASVQERIDLAYLCHHKRINAAAARFAAEAFALQPDLTANLNSGHRYNAACDAALAGRGAGEDAAKLTESQRLAWRKQALSWLRADLLAYQRALGEVPKIAPVVTARMRHWLADTDLAGLRDAEALRQRMTEERQACEQFWAEVEALQKQADKK